MSGHAHLARSSAPAQRNRYRRRLHLENLEARQLLAVDLQTVTVTPTIDEGGTATLNGTINPLQVTNGLQLWLDASDLSTIITDGAGNVEQWLDKSGLGNHATQATAANRPLRNPTAMNGQPAIRFDGVNDGLAISDNLVVARPYTIIIVDQYYGAARNRTLQSRDAGVNWLIGKWGGNNAYYANGFVHMSGVVNNSPTVSVGTGGTGAPFSNYYINGAIVSTDTNPSGSPGRLGLGSSGTFNEQSQADVAEILVYNRILTDAERQSVEQMLMAKYNNVSGIFTGGDANEGLDLQGNFIYAVNFGGTGTAQVQDAAFVGTESGAIPGVTFSAPNLIPNWHAPNYGASANDDALEIVAQSIRWNAGPVTMDLANLVVGTQYKLQLLFAESCCDRGFDIFAEGTKIREDFNIQVVQGGANNTRGVVVTHNFTATDTTLNIVFQGPAPFPDNNPTISGLTLENMTTQSSQFTGGDAGEGLDLDGNFVYAINMGSGAASLPVRNANFRGTEAGAIPGFTFNAPNVIGNWIAANYGSTVNDDNLENVMMPMRWSTAPVTADMANLIPGTRYKLQLLFAEACCDRGFDIFIEGQKVYEDFNVQRRQGGINNVGVGVVVTHTFVAGDPTLNVILQAPTPFPDPNPILNGITLEALPAFEHVATINWGDGTANTVINLPAGQLTFSANHTYVDNKPDGQASGIFTPVVTVVNNSDGTSDVSAARVIGDPLIDRALNDGAVGGLFLMYEPLATAGRVTNWSFFDNDAADNGQSVTPLILEKVGDNFIIRGVGTTRTSNASGIQSFAFGLTAGSDVVGSNFYLGWKDGSNAVNNDGVIDYSDAPPDGIRYFGTGHTGLLTPGRNLAGGQAFVREYSVQFTVDSNVQVNNVAPTAVLGAGPFAANEGNGSVVLSATATDPAGVNDTITLEWDLDNDGIFGETGAAATRGNETGANPTFLATGLDGPGTFPIAVRGRDNDNQAGAAATGSVTINNVAPTAAIDGPSQSTPGLEVTFTFSATDVSPADQAGAFFYNINWGDGTVENNVPGTAILDRTHTYETLGVQTITVTVRDKDGATSAPVSTQIDVLTVAVVDGDLVIAGTDGNDRILIQPGPQGISLRINNKMVPVPGFSGGVIVLGREGNDTVTVSTTLGVPTQLFGQGGNDYLTGGKGDDTLDGGEGADRLLGAGGNDVILGGEGNDSAYGGLGDDFIDGGDGKDLVQGDAGNDTVLGGEGNDRVVGSAGNDYLDGGEGSDRLEGGDGHDLLLGRAGGDGLYGGTGRDVLLGGADGDTLYGGKDDDLVVGDTTINDEDEVALAEIWAAWSTFGIAARTDLESYFDSAAVAENDGFETIYGELGNDWFTLFQGDNIRDLKSGDVKNLIVTP